MLFLRKIAENGGKTEKKKNKVPGYERQLG
jgi:hypothetical protein